MSEMKIGLVKFLNARPLDHAFRKNSKVTVHEDTPSRLFDLLMKGDLDAALISSVECLRQKELHSCRTVGVCADSEVTSILYLPNAGSSPPDKVYTDSGSRTSAALLQILLYRKYKTKIPASPCSPELVPEKISETDAGLLIGDSALRYRQTGAENFSDLGQWWFDQEGLPFVYAMWAYPKNRPVPDSFFEEALEQGLSGMEEILAESDYPDLRTYLTETLHYKLNDNDRKSLDRFKERLLEAGLL